MDVYVISLEEAIAQKSTAGQMAAIAAFHIREDGLLAREEMRLNKSPKRLGFGEKQRLSEIARTRRMKTRLISHFSSIAGILRRSETA